GDTDRWPPYSRTRRVRRCNGLVTFEQRRGQRQRLNDTELLLPALLECSADGIERGRYPADAFGLKAIAEFLLLLGDLRQLLFVLRLEALTHIVELLFSDISG